MYEQIKMVLWFGN